MDLGLKDKVALVAAASKGLGRAAAMELAREGAKLVILARSERIDATADEIRKQTGVDVLPIRADLTQPDQIDSAVRQALERFGRIDILILNAGGPPPGSFLTLKPTDWEAAYQLTFMSAVRLCHAVVPHMVERGSGSIVSTQSYTIKQPMANLILSNALRLAVVGLMKSLADELGPKGIRVNTINPAWTSTDRVEQLMADRAKRAGTTPEQEAAKAASEIPLGRMGTVEEYGRAIAWLASPAASFIHGHALLFDGGAARTPL
ncbi:MAG TPA: SDR family oxidoreductase [Anaerolineales bacterium]|nr:SDR family oxidoreductase [Anaerolineales bacterium]